MSQITKEFMRSYIRETVKKSGGGGIFTENKYAYGNTRYTKTTDRWVEGDTVGGIDNPFSGLTVPEALPLTLTSSAALFAANVNADSLDFAFGKGNEGRIWGIGLQLALYAYFMGERPEDHPFNALKNCNTLQEIANSPAAVREIGKSWRIQSLIYGSPFAKAFTYTSGEPFVLFEKNGINLIGSFEASAGTVNIDATGIVLKISGASATGRATASDAKYLFLYKKINIQWSIAYTVGGPKGASASMCGNAISRTSDIDTKSIEQNDGSGLSLTVQAGGYQGATATLTVSKIYLSNQ